jgi:hypothetical protein
MVKSLIGAGAQPNNGLSLGLSNQTVYQAPDFGFVNLSSASSVAEADVQITARAPHHVSNLSVRVVSNTFTFAVVARFRKNGANGNQSASIAAGTTGLFEDVSSVDTLAPGDLFCTSITTPTDAAKSVSVSSILLTLDSDGAAITYPGCHSTSVFDPWDSSSTSALSLGIGWGGYQATASSFPTNSPRMNVSGVLSNLQVRVKTNTRTEDCVVTTRINNANGNQSVTITAGVTGLFEDTTNTDTIDGDDQVGFLLTSVAASGTILVSRVGTMLSSAAREMPLASSGNAGLLVSNEGDDKYLRLLGRSAGAGSTTLTANTNATALRIPFDCVARKMWMRTAGTVGTAPLVLHFSINGSDANQAISIPVSTASGYFEDASNTDDVTAGDDISIHYPAATGASHTLGSWGVTLVSEADPITTAYTELASAVSTTDATQYTFASQEIGIHANRPKIVRVFGRSNSNDGRVARVRVGGVDLTRIVDLLHDSNNNTPATTVAVFTGVVGLTGLQDIIIDFTTDGEVGGTAATQLRCGYEIGETDIDLTAFDTATAGSGTRSAGTTIDVPEGGLVVTVSAVSVGLNSVPLASHTGVANVTTEVMVEGNNSAFACCDEGELAAESARTIQVNFGGSGSVDDHALAVASFGPIGAVNDNEHGETLFQLVVG